MISTIAWVRSVRIDAEGLTAYVDVHSALGPELTSAELRGLDLEADPAALEAAVLSRVEDLCRNELGLEVDAAHQVRLLSRLR